MNFLNGMWLVREGVRIHKAMQAYEIRQREGSLSVLAPTRYITDRGHMLNLPAITVEINAVGEDIIKVRAIHHKGGGGRSPRFEFTGGADSPTPQLREDSKSMTLQSGNLTAVLSKGEGWDLRFYFRGKFLTGSYDGSLAYITTENEGRFMREMLHLSVDECIYGLGERFTPFVKNGQSVVIWNEDGGTCTPQSYKNIPLYLSSRFYGVLVNTTGRVDFEVGSEVVSKVQFSTADEELEYLVIGGDNLKEVIARYNALLGRPALLPAWSFGLWLSTSFTTDYDEETVSSFVEGMHKRDIPLDVFHYDCFWMKGFQWCNFTFDEDVFPDPEGMLRRIKKRGLHTCAWINPYIAQHSPLFDEAAQQGYLLKKPNGDIWQWDLWQAGMGIVDFTNPGACSWYRSKLEALLDMGIDCFKTDFGERIPTDVVYHDGSDPEKMHNYYTYLYNRLVFELLEEHRGKGDAVVLARRPTAGCQRFPLHWGGDSNGTYESMAESLRGGLSLSMCGFGFWSHDIGGFEIESSPDIFKRWVAFGLFSTHSRLHGSKGYRVPWAYDEESCDVLRYYTKLKCRLMPYLYAESIRTHKTGVPLLRSMVTEYPNDPCCLYLDRQYMLGDSLLVAPVFSEDGSCRHYLPEGRWIDLHTNSIHLSGWHEGSYDYFHMPVYARGGAIIPTGSRDDTADYNFLEGICYHVVDLAEGEETEFTAYDNTAAHAQRIRVTRRGGALSAVADRADYVWGISDGFGSGVFVPAGTLVIECEPI